MGPAKLGLVGIARALAREVATRAITVNVVAPGLTETDMLTALGDERIRPAPGACAPGEDGHARRNR